MIHFPACLGVSGNVFPPKLPDPTFVPAPGFGKFREEMGYFEEARQIM